MTKFCEFCGQPTNELGECTCEDYIKSVSMAQNTAPMGATDNMQGENVNQAAPQNGQTAQPVYTQAPQGYTQMPQGYVQMPQGTPQGYVQTPQGYAQMPQGYAQMPQGYAQMPQGYAQAPQGYYAPQTSTDKLINNSKEQFSKSKNMFFNFLKNPIEMISKIKEVPDKLTPIIFGILHGVIIAVIMLLMGFKAKYGIGGAMFVLAVNFIMAGVVYGVAKKYDVGTEFKNVLAGIFTATIPSSVLLLAAYLAKFIYAPAAILLLTMAFLAWVVLEFFAVSTCLEKNKNLALWFYMIILAIVLVASALIAKNACKGIYASFAKSFSVVGQYNEINWDDEDISDDFDFDF